MRQVGQVRLPQAQVVAVLVMLRGLQPREVLAQRDEPAGGQPRDLAGARPGHPADGVILPGDAAGSHRLDQAAQGVAVTGP